MKNFLKTDPAITFDHMHTDEQSNETTNNKISSHVLLFVMEIITIGALLGFMILLMN